MPVSAARSNWRLSRYFCLSGPYRDANDGSAFGLIYSTRSQALVKISPADYVAVCANDVTALSLSARTTFENTRLLVADETDELSEIIHENKSFTESSRVLYRVIQPSANCQLGCDYCGQTHASIEMPDPVSNALIRSIETRLLSGKYDFLSISWFGGEPLMGFSQMQKLSREFKSICQRLSIDYNAQLISNGLALNKRRVELLVNEMGVSAFELTIDGPDRTHNILRPMKNGGETFSTIIKNLHALVAINSAARITIRCNVTEKNYRELRELVSQLHDMGLSKKLGFYVKSVFAWGNEADRTSLSSSDFGRLEIDLLVHMMSLGFRTSILPSRKRRVCMVVDADSVVVAPNGDLYSCTEAPLVDAYLDGRYLDGNLLTENSPGNGRRLLGTWTDEISDSSFPCKSCSLLPLCGGGCPKRWKEGYIACPSIKANLSDRMALAYLLDRGRL